MELISGFVSLLEEYRDREKTEKRGQDSFPEKSPDPFSQTWLRVRAEMRKVRLRRSFSGSQCRNLRRPPRRRRGQAVCSGSASTGCLTE